MPFRIANANGRAALVVGDQYFDLERLSDGLIGPDPMDAVRRSSELHAWQLRAEDGATPDGLLADADLRPPVPNPRSSFAVGLNYRNHAAEAGMELPAAPLVFSKFSTCFVGPLDDVVLNSSTADYEAELVVVIGTGGRNIAANDAWSYVAGVTAGQDISDRALQFAAAPPHFDLGKSRDTYGPLGPVLVSTDSFANPNDIAIVCRVNGETKQADTTASLIFDVPALIAYLSSILTLTPGDVIFTGTPEGVGATKGVFLNPGDVIETEIAGIGAMKNICVA
jgi:2,4-didehydro-3-deoxy-L-rhamnonate hydrolase